MPHVPYQAIEPFRETESGGAAERTAVETLDDN
jgi:hypothetical protein